LVIVAGGKEVNISIFLTSTLDGSELIRPLIVRSRTKATEFFLTPGKDRQYMLNKGLGGAQRLCGQVGKNPRPLREIETDHRTRIQLLYRLSYPSVPEVLYRRLPSSQLGFETKFF
jgi:hypothetical protein